MTATLRSPAKLKPNPAWAPLTSFDRTGWQYMAFGVRAESIGEQAELRHAQEAFYVRREPRDPESLHIRRRVEASNITGSKPRFLKGDMIFGRRPAYKRILNQ